MEYGQRPSRRLRELRRLFEADHLSAFLENGRRDEQTALQQGLKFPHLKDAEEKEILLLKEANHTII